MRKIAALLGIIAVLPLAALATDSQVVSSSTTATTTSTTTVASKPLSQYEQFMKKQADRMAKFKAEQAKREKQFQEYLAKRQALASSSDQVWAKKVICLQTATDKRETLLIDGLDKYQLALKTALLNRSKVLKDAIAIKDKKGRKQAWDKAWTDYQVANKKITADWRNDRNKAWDAYRNDNKACGDAYRNELNLPWNARRLGD